MEEKSNAEKVLEVLKEMECPTSELVRLIPTDEIRDELVNRYDNAMFLATLPRRDEDKQDSQGPLFKYNGNIGCNLCVLHAAVTMLSQKGIEKLQNTDKERGNMRLGPELEF